MMGNKIMVAFKTVFLLGWNLVRIALGRLFHPGRFRVDWLQRISPLCSVGVFERGVLRIGRNCDFAPYCDLEVHGKGQLEIGAGCYFNRGCMVSAQESVTIGEHCLFGPDVMVFDNHHRHSPGTGVSPDLVTAPVSIGSHSWLGAGVIVLKGVRIGRNCVIGAGCVVRNDVPDGSVLVCRQEQVLK